MSRELIEAVQMIAHKNKNYTMWVEAEFISADDDGFCTVRPDGEADIEGVRMWTMSEGQSTYFRLKPKQGSNVLISNMDDQLWHIVGVSELEEVELVCDKIVVNGGNNGGLVIIQSLVDRLNTLEQRFNNHQHSYASAGGPAVTTPEPTYKPIVETQVSDLEDGKFKH